jgi:hypothetical protein
MVAASSAFSGQVIAVDRLVLAAELRQAVDVCNRLCILAVLAKRQQVLRYACAASGRVLAKLLVHQPESLGSGGFNQRIFPSAMLAVKNEPCFLERSNHIAAKVLQPYVAVALLHRRNVHDVDAYNPAWLGDAMQALHDMIKVLIKLSIVDAVAEVAVAVAVRVERCVRRREDGQMDRVFRKRVQHLNAIAIGQSPVFADCLVKDVHYFAQ